MEGLGKYRWFAQVTIWAGRLPSFAFVPVIPGSYGIFTGQIAWLRELWPKTFKREIERWLQGIYFWRLYLLVPESVKWNFLPGRSLLISPVVRAFVQGWSTVKQNVSYNRNRILNVANLGLELGKIHNINIMKTTGFVPDQKVSISITRDQRAFWKTFSNTIE